MLFPTLHKNEWEGLLRKVMKVRVLLIATTAIGEKENIRVSQGVYREVPLKTFQQMRKTSWVCLFFPSEHPPQAQPTTQVPLFINWDCTIKLGNVLNINARFTIVTFFKSDLKNPSILKLMRKLTDKLSIYK